MHKLILFVSLFNLNLFPALILNRQVRNIINVAPRIFRSFSRVSGPAFSQPNSKMFLGVKYKAVEQLKPGVKNKTDPNQFIELEDGLTCTRLHLAIMQNNAIIVKGLLSHKKTDITLRTSNGDTPLHIAAANGNVEIVKLLINKAKETMDKEQFDNFINAQN